ncbi:hypothetical protein B566_EDAN004764 [Ephemera danica]|nr:hypothetical protein B566_EDAN004764 [Ephemera danica]
MTHKFIFFLFLTAKCAFAEFSAEDCSALGFSKANLLCSSCDTLQDFGLEDLRDHCRQCCHRDESLDFVKRYHSARLEVCTCKFGAYPQIQAFIKSDRPNKFRNLQIRYVLAIEKWDTDTVEEFLKTHLEP